MIVFARGDRRWGNINARVSEKVFDINFVGDYMANNEYSVEVPTQRKANPFWDIGMRMRSLEQPTYD
jgi:hypothetical protein